MNAVVLLKQVPDTESLIEINADGSDIKTENLKWILNPYDELAVEEAVGRARVDDQIMLNVA